MTLHVDDIKDTNRETRRDRAIRRDGILLVGFFFLAFLMAVTEGDLRHNLGILGTFYMLFCLWSCEHSHDWSRLVWRRNGEADSEPVQPDDYEKLIGLKGCGPATAEKIIEKVRSGNTLTDRERGFWDRI
jgi:hypothetical protein